MLKQPTYQSYKEQSVMTMTPVEMLTMLYDGILKELYIARKNFAQEPLDIAEINDRLQKIQGLFRYLKNSLDKNYDIANNLYSLYDYCTWLLTQANMKKEPAGFDEVEEIVRQLKEAYIQADKNARMHA